MEWVLQKVMKQGRNGKFFQVVKNHACRPGPGFIIERWLS